VLQQAAEEEEGGEQREEKEERGVARQQGQKRSGLGVDVESEILHRLVSTQYSVLCACVYNTLYTRLQYTLHASTILCTLYMQSTHNLKQ